MKKPRVFTAVSHDVKALQMPYCWLWHDGKRGFLIYSLDDFLRKLKAIGFPCLCPLDFFKQKIQSTECLHARLKGLKGPHSNRWRKFGSQISDFWTDAATVVGRVREEGARRKKIKVWRVKEKRDREREREREGERGREGERERERGGERERDSEPQPLFGSSVGSFCHPCITTTYLSCRFPIVETSATALCGTTGINAR